MAVFGLGKNTPVKLSMGKSNYEALIGRHGQWVRWYRASKCACVSAGNQPDVKCQFCHGTGYTYSFQTGGTETLTLRIERGNVAKLSSDYAAFKVESVYTTGGKDLSFTRYGDYLQFGTDALSGDYVQAVLTDEYVCSVLTSGLEHIGGKYYRLSACVQGDYKTDGLYYTVPGDIISVGSITDAAGNTLTISEIRQNIIKLSAECNTAVTVKDVEWIVPFKLLVLSQNFSKVDAKIVETSGGDAVLSYPFCYNVADGDIITVLSGFNVEKAVLQRSSTESAEDVINAYFVSDIERIFTPARTYQKGTDFILAGTNRILWLTDNKPAAGSKYSIVYYVNPTYTVLKDMPSLRTSENQRIPRKSVLKLMAAFAENRRLNRND